jgi:hypothetical protein
MNRCIIGIKHLKNKVQKRPNTPTNFDTFIGIIPKAIPKHTPDINAQSLEIKGDNLMENAGTN